MTTIELQTAHRQYTARRRVWRGIGIAFTLYAAAITSIIAGSYYAPIMAWLP